MFFGGRRDARPGLRDARPGLAECHNKYMTHNALHPSRSRVKGPVVSRGQGSRVKGPVSEVPCQGPGVRGPVSHVRDQFSIIITISHDNAIDIIAGTS